MKEMSETKVDRATLTAARAEWEKGAFVIVAEYRAGRVEKIAWRDKATGQPKEMQFISHALEVGGQPISMRERVPDGADLSVWVQPAAKGSAVVVRFDQLETEKGVRTLRGTVQPL